MKRPSTPILALGVILAISGALFAQSRDRHSDRSSRSSSSWGTGSVGPMTNSTAPGFTASSPKPGQPLPGDFAILEEKSIFEKDRHISRPQFPTDSPPHEDKGPPPPSVVRAPAIPVLVGVMIGDDGLIAYIEDPDNGAIWPLAPNDPLPAPYGVVKKITLDDIEITSPAGLAKHILIGQNLLGDAPPAPSSYSSSALSSITGNSATQPDGSAPAIDINSANLTVEQKMKLKRLQQLGK